MIIEVFDGATRKAYIATVLPGASMTIPLDKIGKFSFSFPASDPAVAEVVSGRRVYGYEMGALRLSGIVETLEPGVADAVPVVKVSGPAIARELAHCRVGELALREEGFVTAVSVFDLKIDFGVSTEQGGIALEGPNDQPSAYDGNPATYSEESVGGVDWWRVYIGATEPFTKFHFICGPGNGVVGAFGGQYFNGASWEAITVTSDGTAVAGNTFQQNGDVEFTLAVGDEMVQTTEQGRSAYFVRCYIGTTSDKARLYEAQTWGHVPTDTALALVAAEFPTTGDGYAGTWTLDTTNGLSATVKTDVYDTIYGGNVFEALTKLAELTGEHFYCTADRKVVWIGNTNASSGVRIYSAPVPRQVETDATVALLTGLTVTHDASERVTRVYPHGAGVGDGALDLTYTTKAAPAGYVLSATNNYIRIDPEGTRVDGEAEFKDIGAATADQRERERAANALFDAALVWLGRHSATVTTYAVECANLAAGAVKPGNTVWLDYRRYVAGTEVVVIDDDVIVLETTETFGESAAVLSALTVSTVAQWPVTDTEYQTRMYRNQRAMGTTPQSLGLQNVRTADFAVDGRAMTTGGGGLVYGGSSPASGTVVSGGMEIHKLTGGWHSESGLTAGRYLRAEDATTFAWASIADADLPATIVRTSRMLTAGPGLTGGGDLSADRSFAVGAGAGLTVNADDVALTTPGSLSATSTNSATGNHTHAITSSSNPGAAASILASDASGGLRLVSLGIGSDAALVRPAANGIAPASGDHLQSTTYTAGVAGWRITADGNAEFANAYIRGELHASVFVKDMIEAHAGTMVIAKSAGKISRDMTVPTSGTWFMYLADPPGGGYLFTNGDIARVKAETASGVLDVWFTVDSRATTGGGEQRYTCTYQSGSHAAEYVYPKGSVAMDYGVSGQGYLMMTADLSGAPYYDVRTHAGAPWTTETVRTRLGNLNGSYGITSNYYGIGIGDSTAVGDYLAYDPTNGLRLQAVGGVLNIDSTGLRLAASSSYSSVRAYGFTSGGTYQMGLEGYVGAGYPINNIRLYANLGNQSNAVSLVSQSYDAGYYAVQTKGVGQNVEDAEGIFMLSGATLGVEHLRVSELLPFTVSSPYGLKVYTSQTPSLGLAVGNIAWANLPPQGTIALTGDVRMDTSGKYVGLGASSARWEFNSGEIHGHNAGVLLDSAAWLGLGSSAGRMVVTDTATWDVVHIANAAFGIGPAYNTPRYKAFPLTGASQTAATWTTIATITMATYTRVYIEVKLAGLLQSVGTKCCWLHVEAGREGSGAAVNDRGSHLADATYFQVVASSNDALIQFKSDGTNALAVTGIAVCGGGGNGAWDITT